MDIRSSLTPWPLPSRFSKEPTTEVREPPVLLVRVERIRIDDGTRLTLPRLDVLVENCRDKVGRVQVQVLANLGVLLRVSTLS